MNKTSGLLKYKGKYRYRYYKNYIVHKNNFTIKYKTDVGR